MTSRRTGPRALLSLVALSWSCGPSPDGRVVSVESSVAPAPQSTTPTTTRTTPTTTTPATTTPATARQGEWWVLERGDKGSAVREVQERLRQLRFWVQADGDYGFLTQQAVYAFQKANGIVVDGRVGPETRAALENPLLPTVRSAHGRAVEIDKTRQLLYAVRDGKLQWVFNTSTGTELPYRHPGGYKAMADTPPGTHSVFSHFDGWHKGVLGPLYRPKYFHGDGIAVHGYDDVPPYPASHGCVRVTISAMDYIWASGLMPLGSTVLVYGESPLPGSR